jgi:hypothetical protein
LIFTPRNTKRSNKTPPYSVSMRSGPENGVERGAPENGKVAAAPLVVNITVKGTGFPFEI